MLRVLGAVVMSLAAALPVPVGDDVAVLSARLRDPKLALEERDQIRERLLGLGEEGARVLQRHLEEQSDKLDGKASKHERRYLADVERGSRKTIEARLTKARLVEVERLQKELGKLRSDPLLSKERVHEVGDPALLRLKELLDVTIDDVTQHDPDLATERQRLVEELFELEETFRWWQRCNAALPERKQSKALSDPSPRWPAIEAAEWWTCRMATPMSQVDRATFEQNRVLERELPEPEEALGIFDLNLLRVRVGLNALLIDVKLCNASRDHSNDMRTLGFFAHESPVEGKKTPWERAARAGTSASGENIAAGQSTGEGANRAWWYSPGHHKNMLGGHSRVGLGRSESLWTQMFG
jgi:hypothetical protein